MRDKFNLYILNKILKFVLRNTKFISEKSANIHRRILKKGEKLRLYEIFCRLVDSKKKIDEKMKLYK